MADRRTPGVIRQLIGAATPDPELLALFRDHRDEAAFAELVRRHGRLVRTAAARVLRDPADVDDVAQAAFLVLVRRAGALDARSGLGPWLYGVAHRVAVRLRERNRRKPGPLAAEPPDRGPPAEPSWREACDLLHDELDRLPDRYRLPLLLCYLEGQTRDEAAAALGVTAGTVKGLVRRGCDALRRRLARRGVSLSAGLLAAVAGPVAASAGPPDLAATVLGAPSPRASELAREVTVGTTLWKWAAGVAAVLILGTGAVIAAALGTGERPAAVPEPRPTPAPAAARAEPVSLQPQILYTDRADSVVHAVAFGPGGRLLVTGGQSVSGPDHGHVRFRDAASGKTLTTAGFPHGVEDVAISPDGKLVAVGTGGLLQGPKGKPYKIDVGKLAILSAADGKEVRALRGGAHSYRSLAFSPDGSLLASGGSAPDETGAYREVTPVNVWEVATGKEKRRLAGQPGYVRGLAFSPDGKTLAVGSQVPREGPRQPSFGHLRLWDVDMGKQLFELKGHTGPVWKAAFRPDGKALATGAADGTVRLWDPATGKELAAIKSGAAVVTALAFSPDGRLLAAGGGDPGDADAPGVLKVWDVEARKEVAELKGPTRTVLTVAFSPDGSRLAAGEQRGTLTVWSLGR